MSDNKELYERLNYLDEVLNNLIKKNNDEVKKAADSYKTDALEKKIDTLIQKTDRTNELLETFHHEYSAQGFANVFETLDQKIAAIPKVVLTRHRHSFESKSWGYLAVVGILIAITAIAVGLAVGYHIDERRMETDADKYEIMKALYPASTGKVNADYENNSDSLKNAAAEKVRNNASK